METLEEALEQAKKELEEEGTYRMPTTAYPEEEWEEQKVKGWPRPLHIFLFICLQKQCFHHILTPSAGPGSGFYSILPQK